MARRDDWTTPQKLFNWLDSRFRFNLDAAASKKSTKCEQYYNARENFLAERSKPASFARIFCNPPYSLDKEFAEKCHQLYLDYGISSLLLLPVRSDRVWYQELLHSKNVRDEPYTGRIHFGGSGKGAFMYNINVIIGFKETPTLKYIDAGEFNDKGRGSATT